MMKFIDLNRQYVRLQTRIEKRVMSILENGQYILGPEVVELERQLASFVGVKHAIAVANGTDAITLSLLALGVGPGDAVFVPSFTFFATAEAVQLVGATPVFVDVNEDTYNIDPGSLEKAIEQTTQRGDVNSRAVIAVDIFGLPANYPEIADISDRRNLLLIEDGAQGFGGLIGSKHLCSFGHIATTSFFPAKPLACYGDGGAVFTDDDELADRIRSLRVHGKGRDKYDNIRIGLNSRLDTIQAGILLEKLTIFDDEILKRNEIARNYVETLEPQFVVPVVPEGYVSAWAQFTIRSRNHDREFYLQRLKVNGIPTAIYYGKPLHLQTAFLALGYAQGDLPVSEMLSREVFSLPMHPYLTDDEIEKITGILNAP